MREYGNETRKLLEDTLLSVTQELRILMAPLYAAVDGMATLEARERDPEMDKKAACLTQSYYRINRLVCNLSEAAEPDCPGLFPTLANDDIVGLTRAVCLRAEEPFEQNGVTLVFESNKSGQIIALDAVRIERMLLNLLSNALKFTTRGGTVTVSVHVTKDFVRLTVSDTGRGIPPERLDNIFDRFPAGLSLDPPPHGLGLGLAICQRIARGHGGNIVAESAYGHGARFTVVLPNRRSASMQLRQDTTSYDGGFNRTLLELSDALTPSAFTYNRLD